VGVKPFTFETPRVRILDGKGGASSNAVQRATQTSVGDLPQRV
jgi:hypothetical protein